MTTHRQRILLTLGALLCLILPSPAEEWLLFWREGEKPRRSMFFLATDVRSVLSVEEEIATVTQSRTQAEMDRAAQQARTVRVQVMQIYESPDGPYASTYWADFRARDQMGRLEKGIHWYRDDRDHADFNSPTWQPVPLNWQRRAFDMAMSEPTWGQALQRGRATGLIPHQELRELGAVYVGRHVLPTQLADLTWATFWQDEERPAWEFSPRSAHQIAQERQETMEYLQWAQGQLARMEAEATQEAEQLAAQRREEERRAEASRRRPASSLNQRLETWLGASAEALTARMGQPSSVRQEGSAQLLTYSTQRTAPMTQQVLAPNGRDMITTVVGQQVLWSHITYIIVDGRVYDFVAEGNDPEL